MDMGTALGLGVPVLCGWEAVRCEMGVESHDQTGEYCRRCEEETEVGIWDHRWWSVAQSQLPCQREGR